MRTGEVCGLTWDDIDFEKETINIQHNVYDKPKDGKGRWYIGTTKTETGTRKIHLSQTLKIALQNYKKKQDYFKKIYGRRYIYYNVEDVKNQSGKVVEHRIVREELSNKDSKKIKAEKEKDRYNELYGDIIKNSKKYGISIDQTKFIKPKWYIQNRLNNESYKELINASDNIKKLGNIFPLIFFAISILVSLISMMRMIEEDRTENGTLKSLGYNNFEITLKYIIYSLLATIIGSISGVFIGSYLIPYVIWNIYKKLFFIPKFIYLINSSFNALGLLICTLCICGTAIFVCIHNLKEKPANLMRPKNPKSGKKIFIEKINFIWKKIKFSEKITIRNIFRYKARVFTTIFGIAGCTALILAGFGLKDSIKEVTNYQFNNIFKYDKTLIINENKDYNLIKNYITNDNDINKFTEVNTQTITVEYNNKEQDVTLVTPNNFKELKNIIYLSNIDDGKEIEEPPYNTCIISEKTSKLLNIKIGDTLAIINNENNNKEIKVSYITKNYINQYIYITKETYNNIFNNYNINSFLVDLKEINNEEKESFDTKYISEGYVSAIVNNEDIKNSINDMLSSIDSIVAILIIAATALAFVVLYNLSNINISERKREIATLKVLGFYPKEVDKYINSETFILTTIGIIIGLIFGSYLSHFIISTCEPDYIMFDRNVFAISYIYSILITTTFTIIVNIVTHFNLKKINMIESLKNVE
jgi:putative ABC transport system permease protein